jgi:putative FmdB family regulatory protein
MPIYEYECTTCHHKFDLLQKISEEKIEKCPECSKNTAIRLVSAAGFQFKSKGKPEQRTDTNATTTDTKSADKKTEASTTSSVTTKGESD